MNRRTFMASAMAAGAVGMTVQQKAAGQDSTPGKFKLKYAPDITRFSNHVGKDPIENIKFMADQGFTAVFDNGLMGKSPSQQEAIRKELEKQNMDLGPFVMYADFGATTFVLDKKEVRDMIKPILDKAVETQQRTGVKTALLVPGRFDNQLEWDYQTANVVDNLRFCMETMEKTNLIMVLEPLNRWNHPGLFLTGIPQAYAICRAVNHNCCKIVNDMYHQQITEGNLIPNIDRAWSEIGAFHVGDNPGRKEPTTGEINYQNIFKHIYLKGYQGVLCLEHGISKGGKEGEQAFINAYRYCDNFAV